MHVGEQGDPVAHAHRHVVVVAYRMPRLAEPAVAAPGGLRTVEPALARLGSGTVDDMGLIVGAGMDRAPTGGSARTSRLGGYDAFRDRRTYQDERPFQMGHHQAQKAVIDAKRGKMFAKLIKNIEVAARVGGVTRTATPRCGTPSPRPKKSSVPNDNIERARKRGAGEEAGGADWQNITYEGYGPNGVAVLIRCLTDNRNRAAGEVRVAMTRNGGNMADPGSVAYLFARKGVVILRRTACPRTTCCSPSSRPAPRRSTTSVTASRSSASRPTWWRCAPRCRTPASSTTPPRPASSRR